MGRGHALGVAAGQSRESVALVAHHNLTDPAIDASVAEFVHGAIRRKFGKPPEAFVVDRRAAFRDNRSNELS